MADAEPRQADKFTFSATLGSMDPAAPPPSRSPAGIDLERVEQWFSTNLPHAAGPLHFHQIAGGHSNLTFEITDSAGQRFVLRRPPLGHRLASAHDMGREFRLISALQDSAVPVPEALGFCDDVEVTGAEFYVMGFIDGHVIRDRDAAESHLDTTARAGASASIVDTLAALHSIEPDEVGLGDLARHDGYIERQLKRWYGQWNQQHTRELPEIDATHTILLGSIPPQGPACLVHGDYRLDNCMVDGTGRVIAVLDWEICTLGDPLADLGLLMVYWTGPDDTETAWDPGATASDGFWNRVDLAAHYGAATGRDLSELGFYEAFAYWKLACILEGVYARYLGGALGERDPAELAYFKARVEAAAHRAHELATRLGGRPRSPGSQR